MTSAVCPIDLSDPHIMYVWSLCSLCVALPYDKYGLSH
jgi:hypothetical protein